MNDANIPVNIRVNIDGLLIVATRRKEGTFFLYYILSDGELSLHEDKFSLGQRKIEVRKKDIICLWRYAETGFEEFCGFYDINGSAISPESKLQPTPERYSEIIREWVSKRPSM